MCSLKRLADLQRPEFWSASADEGWVSGWTQTPPACANISARACTRCSRSRDPAACLKCATTLAAGSSMLDGALSRGLSRADGCASCYDSDAPAKCVACLNAAGSSSCAQCALQEPQQDTSSAASSNPSSAKFNVSACIDCTAAHGPAFRDACAALGHSNGSSASPHTSAQQPMQRCMSCLATMKPLACSSTDYQSGCWNPELKPSSCATCASAQPAAQFDTCLACLTSQPFSDNCEACSRLSSPAAVSECYACSKAAAHPGSGCTDCLSYLPGQ